MAGERGAIEGYKLDESTVKGFISDLPCQATRVRPALPLRPTRSRVGQSPPSPPPFLFSCSSLPCKQRRVSIEQWAPVPILLTMMAAWFPLNRFLISTYMVDSVNETVADRMDI